MDEETQADIQVRMFAIDQANRLTPGHANQLVKEASKIYGFLTNKPVEVVPVEVQSAFTADNPLGEPE